MDLLSNQFGHERGYSIAYLPVLCGAGAHEEIIVWERLQASCLTNGQAPTLKRIRVDVVMSIPTNVARDSCCWTIGELYPEPVREHFPALKRFRCALMVRQEIGWKVGKAWGRSLDLCKTGRIQVAVKVIDPVCL